MAVTHVAFDMAKHKSGRRAHHLGMEDEATESRAYHNAAYDDYTMEDQRLMAANMALPEGMRLEPSLFNCIPCESRRDFVRNRRELLERQTNQNSQNNKEDDKPNAQTPKPLPNQYNRANVSYKEDASDSDSTLDEQEFMGMVAAFNDVNC